MNNSSLRTMDVLELLTQGPMTVTQVSRELGIPKTSAFDILSALCSRQFAQCDEHKQYSLGLSAYRIGMAYIGGTDLYSAGHARLTKLCRKLQQTVYLAVEDRGRVVYIDKAEQDSPIRFTRRPGDRNELYRTGLGKAIMALRPELAEKLEYPLPRRTATTVCTREELMEELERTRARGYALDLGEDNQLLRCIAVPVLDREGVAIGALSCSMLASEFEITNVAVIAAELTAAALDISRALGYTGSTLF